MDNQIGHFILEKNKITSNIPIQPHPINHQQHIQQQQHQQIQQQNQFIDNNNNNYFNSIKNNPNSGLFFNFKANINNDNYPTVCAHKSICLICNKDTPPCLSSRSVSWVSILRVVFYSLKYLYPEKEYFNLKKDVYGYVATHWSLICTKKKKTPGWRKQLQDALSHCRRLFESGADHHECYGFWKLKDMSDPWEENGLNDSSTSLNSSNNGNNANNGSGNGSPFSNPSSPQLYTSPLLSPNNLLLGGSSNGSSCSNSSPNYPSPSIHSGSINTTPLLVSTTPPNFLTTSANNISNSNRSRYSPVHLNSGANSNNNNNGSGSSSSTPKSLIPHLQQHHQQQHHHHHSRSNSNGSMNGFNLHNPSPSSSSSSSSSYLYSNNLTSSNSNSYINDLSNLGISSPILINSVSGSGLSRPRSKSLGNSFFQLDSPSTKPQILSIINNNNNNNNTNNPNIYNNYNNSNNNNINNNNSFNNFIINTKTKRSNSQQYYTNINPHQNNFGSMYRSEKLPKLIEDYNQTNDDEFDNDRDHQVPNQQNNNVNNINNNNNINISKDKASISNLLNDSFDDEEINNNNNTNNSNININNTSTDLIRFKFSRKRSFDLT